MVQGHETTTREFQFKHVELLKNWELLAQWTGFCHVQSRCTTLLKWYNIKIRVLILDANHVYSIKRCFDEYKNSYDNKLDRNGNENVFRSFLSKWFLLKKEDMLIQIFIHKKKEKRTFQFLRNNYKLNCVLYSKAFIAGAAPVSNVCWGFPVERHTLSTNVYLKRR